MDKLNILIIGFITGIVDAVPGVSGATMLLIFRVYERVIEYSSSLLYKQLPKFVSEVADLKFSSSTNELDFGNMVYLTALLIGIGTGLICSLLIFESLIETTPSSVFGLFTGLILGSSYIIWSQNKEIQDNSNIKWMIGGILLSSIIVISTIKTGNSVPIIFISGFIASFGMLLPGLSGSFLLLVIGKYSFITELVSQVFKDPSSIVGFNGIQSIVLGLGGLIGIALNLKTVSYFMNRNKSGTLSFILGLVIGGALAPIREYFILSEQNPTLFLIFGAISLITTLLIGYLKGN